MDSIIGTSRSIDFFLYLFLGRDGRVVVMMMMVMYSFQEKKLRDFVPPKKFRKNVSWDIIHRPLAHRKSTWQTANTILNTKKRIKKNGWRIILVVHKPLQTYIPIYLIYLLIHSLTVSSSPSSPPPSSASRPSSPDPSPCAPDLSQTSPAPRSDSSPPPAPAPFASSAHKTSHVVSPRP